MNSDERMDYLADRAKKRHERKNRLREKREKDHKFKIDLDMAWKNKEKKYREV